MENTVEDRNHIEDKPFPFDCGPDFWLFADVVEHAVIPHKKKEGKNAEKERRSG